MDTVRSRDPEADQRMAFERDLRAAVARAMGDAASPPTLRERIIDAIRAHKGGLSAAERLRMVRPEDHPTVYRARPALRKQLWLAAAAAMVIVVGLLAMNPGGMIRWGPPVIASSGVPVNRITRFVSFTVDQHEGCAGFERHFKRKMTARTQADAIRTAIEILSKVPSVLELRSADLAAAGYHFAGLGPCAVPGRGRSVHMLYKPDPSIAPGAPVVSLFAQEDVGDLPFATDACFSNAPRDEAERASGGVTVTVWRKNGLIFYLVAPPLPSEIRRAFDAPEEERSLL